MVAERYIVLGWTSSMIGGPLLMGANQSSYHYGLVYSTRLGNLRGRISRICDSPPLPPTYVLLASIVLLCFIEYTLKADTPDIWPKLNFCSHRRWAFLPYFLTSIQTPHLWYYWCTRQYGHVRAVFDSILNTFFLEFVQAQDLLGFVALGPRTPIFKNWV